MKKLLNHHSIITFVLSFLFTLFVCMNNVKAEEIEFQINPSDFDFIENNLNTAKNTLDNLISSSSSYSSNYFIVKWGNDFGFFIVPSNSNLPFAYYSGSSNVFAIELNNSYYGTFNSDFTSASVSSQLGAIKYIYKNNKFYYSSFKIYFNSSYFASQKNDATFNFLLNDFKFSTINNQDNFLPSLSDVYEEYQKFINPVPEEPEDHHLDEKEKISNFYNLIGEKLGYLSEQITKSYILLTIIGIFILIFVFELIYRRYL